MPIYRYPARRRNRYRGSSYYGSGSSYGYDGGYYNTDYDNRYYDDYYN